MGMTAATMSANGQLMKIDPLGDSPESKLVKALLSIEWRRHGEGTLTCQGCGSWTFKPTHVRAEQVMDNIGCYVDEALTAAGYPDQDSREKGREIIRKAVTAYRDKLHAKRWLEAEARREFEKSG
jgi:hypothetical protein